MLKAKEERQCLVCLQYKDVLEFPRICGGGNEHTPRQHICRACKKVACNAATKAKHSASIRARDRERKRREAERIRALGYGKGNGGWEYKPNQSNQYAELTALLVREDADGALHLIDGEMRSEIAADAEVPVLVLDVTEEEADYLLATLDPVTSPQTDAYELCFDAK